MTGPARRIALLLGALTGMAGAGYYFLMNRFQPQTRGNLKIHGLDSQVEVIRDKWGIPHIFAQNETDLMFAQGFVHAQDRLWQMDFQRRMVAGRLSEILGEVSVPLDRWMRILGMRRAAERELQLIPAQELKPLDAYTAGVNACIALDHHPFEITLLRYRPEPWSVVDSVSWGKMLGWTLSVNWEVELLRAKLIAKLGVDKAAELEPDTSMDEPYIIPPGTDYSSIGNTANQRAESARPFTGPIAKAGLGSNSWVLSGSRTSTGRPILANDMHLFMGIPAIWYENHLVCGDLELSGITFPGVLGIVAGQNRHIAWGFTNGFPDVQDLYMEHLRRTDQGQVQYEYQNEWINAEVIQEQIKIKGGKSATQEVVVTRHGPIINQLAPDFAGETPIALRWTAHDPERLFMALQHMARARNCLEFREALRDWGTPAQNVVYADTQGNIAYSLAGRVPIRAKGDGRLPVPGWTGEYEWNGLIPFEELPHLFNPPQGYVVTANNRVVERSYPHFLGNDYVSANRARRIRELIEANPNIDVAFIERMQYDQISPHARAMAKLLGELEPDDPELKVVIERMEKWDGALMPDSPETAVYEIVWRRMILLMTSPKLGDLAIRYLGKGPIPILEESSLFGERAGEWLIKILGKQESDWFASNHQVNRDQLMITALRQAIDELKHQFGPDFSSWKWKKLHKIRFAHHLGSVKPLDKLLNRGPYPLGGDSNTVWCTATAYHDVSIDQLVGPPFRFIADLRDLDHCLGMLAPGESGNPLSKHYADQIKPWFSQGYHPMIVDRQELEKATEDKLNLIHG